jgi:hypothetical protein
VLRPKHHLHPLLPATIASVSHANHTKQASPPLCPRTATLTAWSSQSQGACWYVHGPASSLPHTHTACLTHDPAPTSTPLSPPPDVRTRLDDSPMPVTRPPPPSTSHVGVTHRAHRLSCPPFSPSTHTHRPSRPDSRTHTRCRWSRRVTAGRSRPGSPPTPPTPTGSNRGFSGFIADRWRCVGRAPVGECAGRLRWRVVGVALGRMGARVGVGPSVPCAVLRCCGSHVVGVRAVGVCGGGGGGVCLSHVVRRAAGSGRGSRRLRAKKLSTCLPPCGRAPTGGCVVDVCTRVCRAEGKEGARPPCPAALARIGRAVEGGEGGLEGVVGVPAQATYPPCAFGLTGWGD